MKLLVEPTRQAFTLFIVTLVFAWPAAADERLESMLNEDLSYGISFLWFDNLAMGRIRLQPGSVAGTYIASLEAHTLGLTAFLTRHRRSRYETTMELADGRLRPIRYEKVGSRGTGNDTRHRRTIYEFDYVRRKIRFRKVKTGFPDRREIRPMPDGDFSDILTALYNLRAGFVGPLVPGADYTFPTMVSDESETIVIRALDAAERESYNDFPAGGQLFRVLVGRDVFDTGEGAVLVWVDDAGRPGRTVVENVLALGDVTGTLTGSVTRPAADGDETTDDAGRGKER